MASNKNKNVITVVVDEGSTYTKVAYVGAESNVIKTLTIPNSFRRGWKTGFAGVSPANYQVGNTKYCYDKTADIAFETTNIAYQYSDQSLLSVHHALIATGLEPQEINLVVTLPVTQYYRADDNQVSDVNVQRKVDNLRRELVRMNDEETFTFATIEVRPESLPAALSELARLVHNDYERTLCIDAGGTTLDYGVIVGAYDDISDIGGNEDIGVVSVTKAVKNALANASSDVSQTMANEFIIRRNDPKFVDSMVNDKSFTEYVLEETDKAIDSYTKSVIAEIQGFGNTINRILIAGGGGHLLIDPIKEAFPIIADRIKLIDNPQLALASELMKYFSEDSDVHDAEVEVVEEVE